jgi:uncharacterized protein YndB with AHSA1/START domain
VKRELSHTIEIAASPGEVWAVVSDTASFPTWNPFTRKLEGELRTGAKLSVTIEPPGRRSTNFPTHRSRRQTRSRAPVARAGAGPGDL